MLNLSALSPAEMAQAIAILEELQRRKATSCLHRLFPDARSVWDGPPTQVFLTPGETIYERQLYPKHLEFFGAGRDHRERGFVAGNRVGKSIAGGYEISLHLTGLYPPWWPGRRFNGAVNAWACGKTNETTRDIVQKKLLGEVTFTGNRKILDGTGIVPADLIEAPAWKMGVPDMVDAIRIRHAAGGFSTLGFKSYQQGRGAFEGTEQHVIWLDEEPPMSIYGECLIRTATTDGLIMLTFTPLAGRSEVVMQFMPAEDSYQEV